MNPPSLLIVDDESNNFDVIEVILSDSDYILHYASSGEDAFKALKIYRPDVILLDVMMPGLDGIEVCQHLKKSPDWQAIPIIMVTALSAKKDLVQCLQAGADDFISKPIDALELRARIQSMLRIKQQYDNIKTLSQLQIKTIELLQSNLNELRNNLFANLPHEINTPLNGISGVISLMIERFENLSPQEIRLLLRLAQQSAQRLENLTQKFLTYAELDLLPAPDNHCAIQRSSAEMIFICSLLKSTALEQANKVNRKADLLLNLNDVKDIKVAILPKDLQCILQELLDNAFKFSQPGTPIRVAGKVLDNRLDLWVCDRGRGMTSEQIAHIGAFRQFERQFYAQQGLGLGLKIVKKITEIYGGELLISSVYQQETHVHAILPLTVIS